MKRKIDSMNMSDKEAEQHAQKVFTLIQQNPKLKLLQDLVKSEIDSNSPNSPALQQFLYIMWDFIGVHYNEFNEQP